MSAPSSNKMHAAETSGVTACSGQRALSNPVGGEMRAARIEMDAAESFEPAASCGRRFHTSADDVELGSPDTDRPLSSRCDSGTSPVAVSSQNCAGQGSQPARRLSKEEYIRIAVPLLAKGATWRQVGKACGLSWRAAKGRGEHAGLVSKRGPGRPLGALHTPETRARITATLRRRWLEGRR